MHMTRGRGKSLPKTFSAPTLIFMSTSDSMKVGIIVEQRPSASPWINSTLCPVDVVPGAAPSAEWREVSRQKSELGEAVRYLAATLPIELFAKETQGYLVNLADSVPRVYVIMREDEDVESGFGYTPFLATVCPFEAQDYMDSGEDIVEGVPMPPAVATWLQAWCDTHHTEEKFVKRKRQGGAALGQEPFTRIAPVNRDRKYDA